MKPFTPCPSARLLSRDQHAHFCRKAKDHRGPHQCYRCRCAWMAGHNRILRRAA